MQATTFGRRRRGKNDLAIDPRRLLDAVGSSLAQSGPWNRSSLVDTFQRRRAALLAWFQPEWVVADNENDPDKVEALTSVMAGSEIVTTSQGY
jgi:hypothetical protein